MTEPGQSPLDTAPPGLVEALLGGPYPCFISTLDRDGKPYGVVVWCARDGSRITVNATEGRWLRNLRRDPRVALVIVDTGNILRHLSVSGRAIEVEPDADYAHIDSLSQIYERRPYQYSTPDDVARFRVLIEPDSVRTYDYAPPTETIR